MTRQDAEDAYVASILANAPPLTDEQRTKLAELLRPVRQPLSASEREQRKTIVAARIAELDGKAGP